MRNFFRTSFCAVALFVVAGCGGDTGGNAFNGADTATGNSAATDSTADFTAAADALAAKMNGQTPPAATDPAVQRFETVTAQGLDTLGTPALPLRGFDSYEQLCGKTATVIAAYLNAGTAGASAESRTEIMTRNAEESIDQMFTPLLFAAHCTAAHMPFLEETLTAEEIASQPQALQQIRSGAYQQVMGLLQMAGANDIDAARQQRIVDLLAADADEFALVLTAEQRQELAALTQQIGTALPEDSRGKVATIQQALQQAPCGKLCSA